MERGWNAKGLLAPLWNQLDGPGKREQLAELAGIKPQTLSSYNSGKRQLGIANARKIVAALASAGLEVSVLELGAPEGEADGRGRMFLDRLEELAERLDRSKVAETELTDHMTRLEARVKKLEGQRRAAPAAATRPRTRRSGG